MCCFPIYAVADVNNLALFCKSDTDTAVNYVVVVVYGIAVTVFSDCLWFYHVLSFKLLLMSII